MFSVSAPRGARADAAADQAAHDVLVALYPAKRAGVDQLLSSQLSAIPNGPNKQAGIGVGAAVARRLISLRSNDGSSAEPPRFRPGNKAGDYRPTPPDFPTPVFTNWGSVKPFVLARGRQFRPAPPSAVSGAAYATALNKVKSLGSETSTTRTPDQTAAAKFWAAAPVWNVWNQVAQGLVTSQNASLGKAVKVFARLDLSLADTAIAMYDAKYAYHVWRPVTAIRLGGTHYNPSIVGDPNWTPLAADRTGSVLSRRSRRSQPGGGYDARRVLRCAASSRGDVEGRHPNLRRLPGRRHRSVAQPDLVRAAHLPRQPRGPATRHPRGRFRGTSSLTAPHRATTMHSMAVARSQWSRRIGYHWLGPCSWAFH
ncbi:vanadium-dependent haloperoxidase [Streptomyces olivoverticillatus]